MKRTLVPVLCACVACLSAVHAAMGSPAAVREAEQDAQVAFRHGDYPTAIRLYEDCRTQTPNNAVLLTNLGLAYFQNNQLDAAAQTLRRAVELAPKGEVAYRALGVVHYWQRDDASAFQTLQKALALDPGDAVARKYLALVQARQGGKRRAPARS